MPCSTINTKAEVGDHTTVPTQFSLTISCPLCPLSPLPVWTLPLGSFMSASEQRCVPNNGRSVRFKTFKTVQHIPHWSALLNISKGTKIIHLMSPKSSTENQGKATSECHQSPVWNSHLWIVWQSPFSSLPPSLPFVCYLQKGISLGSSLSGWGFAFKTLNRCEELVWALFAQISAPWRLLTEHSFVNRGLLTLQQTPPVYAQGLYQGRSKGQRDPMACLTGQSYHQLAYQDMKSIAGRCQGKSWVRTNTLQLFECFTLTNSASNRQNIQNGNCHLPVLNPSDWWCFSLTIFISIKC